MKTARNWICAALASLALLALGECLDAQAEAQDTAASATDAVTAASIAAQRDALARRICEYERGPGARVLWTHQGDMVCRPATRTAQANAL
ncbi:hypothetical protein [Hydrogenophaga sp. ANAO-22]|uniref:hypothetical protein n=1 Tax=Hydrogenophaga sp. ANAO-22 TaxID=3166645 RepID=UPI0036D333F3